MTEREKYERAIAWHSQSPYRYQDVSVKIRYVTDELVASNAMRVGDKKPVAGMITRSRLSLASDLLVQNATVGETYMLKVRA